MVGIGGNGRLTIQILCWSTLVSLKTSTVYLSICLSTVCTRSSKQQAINNFWVCYMLVVDSVASCTMQGDKKKKKEEKRREDAP